MIQTFYSNLESWKRRKLTLFEKSIVMNSLALSNSYKMQAFSKLPMRTTLKAFTN